MGHVEHRQRGEAADPAARSKAAVSRDAPSAGTAPGMVGGDAERRLGAAKLGSWRWARPASGGSRGFCMARDLKPRTVSAGGRPHSYTYTAEYRGDGFSSPT